MPLKDVDLAQEHYQAFKFAYVGGVIASTAGVFVTGVDYAKVVSFIQGPITETSAELLLRDLVAHLSYLNEHSFRFEIFESPSEAPPMTQLGATSLPPFYQSRNFELAHHQSLHSFHLC